MKGGVYRMLTDNHRKTVTGSGMDSGDREKEKNPDTGTAHQAARQGSDRSRTCLHAVESGIGNLQPSRQEQAFG